jgi:two-component system, NtrC family, nitrogen regulation sensor histidine kinase NtrY
MGILVAVLASLWFAARVTRPVVSLAEAARRVAAGDLGAKVEVESSDELGELAASFNRMTEDLAQQKDRTLQAERVAAWRELARRLAHELKNPLFPLQVTVENLMRAKQKSPEMFEEVFHEGTATLLAEIDNLKTIIGRFSEFSKMPQPQRRPTQVNDVVRSVLRVFHAQLQEKNQIAVRTELADPLARNFRRFRSAASRPAKSGAQRHRCHAARRRVDDSHRRLGDRIEVSVSDTGSGLTPGMRAPVHSLLHDQAAWHGARPRDCTVGGERSRRQNFRREHEEKGTTFRIELPCDFSAHSASLR